MKKQYVKYLPLLEQLAKANTVNRMKILKDADPQFVRLICESVFNILKGNIKLTERHYRKLSPHKRTLLFLARKENSLTAKRVALAKKKGGAAFLPMLLPVVISLVSSLLGK